MIVNDNCGTNETEKLFMFLWWNIQEFPVIILMIPSVIL